MREVFGLNGLGLSALGMPAREIEIPNTLSLKDKESYQHLADADTLYYDVFTHDGQTVIVAPPLSNAELTFLYQRVLGLNTQEELDRATLHRSQTEAYMSLILNAEIRSELIRPTASEKLIEIIGEGDFRNILYTLQKDNPIDWVTEWVRIHKEQQDVDLVVIYDNGSTSYSPNDLADALADMTCPAVVISVPFKYGPAAPPQAGWGSQHLWLQRACLQHFRMCCRMAAPERDVIVLQMDIDEVMVSDPSLGSVFYRMRALGIDVAHFLRVPLFADADKVRGCVRHEDHTLSRKVLSFQSPKNAFRIQRLALDTRMHHHFIRNGANPVVFFRDAFILHHLGLNTGWKSEEYDRNIKVANPSLRSINYDGIFFELIGDVLSAELPFVAWHIDETTLWLEGMTITRNKPVI